MRHLPLLMCTAFCGLYSTQTKAADTKKRKDPIFFGSPLKILVHTNSVATATEEYILPMRTAFAARGIQFMNTWSVAPQSSAARSSLITGCYSSTYGMDIHPVPYDTPADIFFPQKLREAGYYCTNNSKTHYNSTTDNKYVGTNVATKPHTIRTQTKKNQPFSLYSTR